MRLLYKTTHSHEWDKVEFKCKGSHSIVSELRHKTISSKNFLFVRPIHNRFLSFII